MKPMPQPVWMIAFGHLLGLACIAFGLWAVIADFVAAWWLLPWPFMHLFNSLMVSVGLHRYFSHRAFATSTFWHKLMAYWSIPLLSGSPMGWGMTHNAHHLHSDTELDPHLAVPSYLLWKRYRNVKYDKRTRRLMRHLLRDRDAVAAHNHGTVLWLLFAALTVSIDWKLFVFGYGMALGSVHLFSAMHQVFSHKNGQPRNLPLLEYVLPAVGEWHHATHHRHWGWTDMRGPDRQWWHIDLGHAFIKLIERKNTKNKEAP